MNLINFNELSGEQIEEVVDLGLEIKRHPEKYFEALKMKSLGLIFQKTSTRTRVAFEVAMTQMGGHALYIDWRTTNFTLADIYDESQYLSRNVDCILARLLKNSDLKKMTLGSLVPVINGCDEIYHPSQVIADLISIKEKRGHLEGLEVVFVGIHNNVCNSLIEGCTKTGIKITTVTPIVNKRAHDQDLLDDAKKTGLWKTSLDINEAIKSADFIYTDTWIDMEFFTDPKFAKEKEQRIKKMKKYQINEKLLENNDAYVMHDMPIHRGYEISDSIVESSKSIIYQQSKNRLYSAKAILLKLIK